MYTFEKAQYNAQNELLIFRVVVSLLKRNECLSVCDCMHCVHVHECVYVHYKYVSVCVSVCEYAHVQKCMCMCVQVCVYMCVHMCTCI